MYRCLRHGTLVEGPYRDLHGYWRCTLRHLTAGDEVHVVVAFESRERLIVITVY